MRVVMVTKFAPLPADNGGRQRSLAVARRLAALGEVVLCAYDDGSADRAGLERLGIDLRAVPWRPDPVRVGRGVAATRSLSAGRFWSAALRDEIHRAAASGPVDVLQVEYLQMAPLATGVAAGRRVLDLHNVESALVASYARSRRGPVSLGYRLEAAALRALERRLLGAFDRVVVVSEGDRRRLPVRADEALVCPNGLDPAAPLPPATTPTVAFVATLGWAPNVDAAVWLVHEVWPRVLAQLPEARLLLVGRDPDERVRALASDRVEVTGTVPSVEPYLTRSRVALAPLRAGGGSRLKILEALGAGRPVVATTVGAEGLEDLVGAGVVVADAPGAMATAIAALAGDPVRATSLGAQGHEAVVARYGWDRTLEPLLQVVEAA